MGDEAATILVCDDDSATRAFLADNLRADGFVTLEADCAAEALRLLESKFPDLAVLDVNLPDGSGLELVGKVRDADGVHTRVDPALPLILLSGRVAEIDRVRGFERGTDDYVCKPFSYPELRGRISALLRRADSRRRLGRVRIGQLEIDPSSRAVRLGGEALSLSAKEFALLRTLATAPTRVFTKEELLRTIWGYRAIGSTRTLDSHACRLRTKLGALGEPFVVNVWGVGYRLVDPPGGELVATEVAG